jgi:hypothetical protein
MPDASWLLLIGSCSGAAQLQNGEGKRARVSQLALVAIEQQSLS